MSRSNIISIFVCCAALAGAMDIGTNFSVMKWQRQPDAYFKDAANVTGDNPWNPQFLQDISIYSCFRFLSWNVGHAPVLKTWSERSHKEDRHQDLVAIEWCIDLSNRLHADMWMCTPHATIDRNTGDRPSDYALRMCLLIKTGVDMQEVNLDPLLDRLSDMTADELIAAGGVRTCEPLKPELKVYLEYSNETWNGQFAQCKHSRKEGTALNLSGKGPGPVGMTARDVAQADMSGEVREDAPKPAAGGADAVLNGTRFHAWAAIRNFRAADLVWGKDSKKVVRLLAQQKGQLFQAQQHQAVMDDPVMNPWGVKADAIAIAPYFGRKATRGDDPDAASNLRASIKEQIEGTAKMKAFADSKGLKLVAYEGGQHVSEMAIAINRDPVMYDLYMEYLDAMEPYFEHFSHYMHVGIPKDKGAFGSMEYTGQSVREAHKYRALRDWSQKRAQ